MLGLGERLDFMPLSVGWLVPYFLLVCVCFPSSHFSYIIVIYSPFRVHVCAPRLVECSAILLADWLDEKHESGAHRWLSGIERQSTSRSYTDYFRTGESIGYFPILTLIGGNSFFRIFIELGAFGERAVWFSGPRPPALLSRLYNWLSWESAWTSCLCQSVGSCRTFCWFVCLFPL